MALIRHGGIATLVSGTLLGLGCAAPTRPVPVIRDAGRVLLIPGVDGPIEQLSWTERALQDAGLRGDFEIVAWGVRPFGTFLNLRDIDGNRRTAGELARKLESWQRAEPTRPINLIGFSGGGGLAAFTVEALSPEFRIDRLILVGAAVSPHYDLGPAMRHCRHGIVNFYSAQDWLIIGQGTVLFGTMDRHFTESAGHVGFLNAEGRLRTMPELEQHRWQPDWAIRYGHDGGHLGWLAYAWARDVLAPEVWCGLTR